MSENHGTDESEYQSESDQVEEILDELEESVEGQEAKSRVRESIRLVRRIDNDGVFGKVIKGSTAMTLPRR